MLVQVSYFPSEALQHTLPSQPSRVAAPPTLGQGRLPSSNDLPASVPSPSTLQSGTFLFLWVFSCLLLCGKLFGGGERKHLCLSINIRFGLCYDHL